MSIIYHYRDMFLLSHMDYVSKLYEKVNIEDGTVKSFNFFDLLFCIRNLPTVPSNKRKRKINEILLESSMIKQMYDDLINSVPKVVKDAIKKPDYEKDYVKKYSQKLFESTKFEHFTINGGNNSETSLKCTIMDNHFLIPPDSRFFCGCVMEECKKLNGSKFDIIVIDPPWWNKYIRRLKTANNKMSYSMMYNEDIASIPVKNLFADNCLIVMWCTNSQSNIDAVKNLIFPQWSAKYLATWYWLKLTVELEPLCKFGSGSRKQPYERVIIGSVGEVGEIPDHLLFASVPSALHSHKPPLLELLSNYVTMKKPAVLELFARYLLPSTTSVGYEPLKWQHISLYDSR